MSESEVLLFDVSKLNAIQKELGIPNEIEPGQEPDSATSMFYKGFHKVIWYTIGLESKDGNSEKSHYEVNLKYDYLTRSYFEIVLPEIQLSEATAARYRVRWPTNIGNYIIESAAFAVNSNVWQTLDPKILDVNMQYFENSGAGFRDLRQVAIGNIEANQEWSTSIPRCTLMVDQPWFYSRDSMDAFPLHRCKADTKIVHSYSFNLDVKRLIQIYDTETDTIVNWTNVDNNDPFYKDSAITQKITPPTLWMEYAQSHSKEQECIDSKGPIYIDIIECKKVGNPTGFGESVTIPLTSIYPVKAMFWICENSDCKERHIFANYSTNLLEPTDITALNPVGRVDFESQKGRKFKDYSAEHFSWMAAQHFKSAPFAVGYNAMAFCMDPCSINREPGLVFGAYAEQLHVTLKNKRDVPRDQHDYKFQTFVLSLITVKRTL